MIRQLRFGVMLGAAVSAFAVAAPLSATAAESIEAALARAYSGNPILNAQRAALRATNEGVPQALSGYRPRVTGTADAGVSTFDSFTPGRGNSRGQLNPRGASVQVDQTIWNAGRTSGAVSQAEALVLAGRETLRVSEQTVLLDAATSYMNVLRDTAIASLNSNNVEVLEEQLRQTRDRFNVGEVTRTDVAQAESRLQGARSQQALAQANLKASLSRYRQVVGVQPRRLQPARPVERQIPRTLEEATRAAQSRHPSILSALHAVDAADQAVRVAEAELYPTLGFTGTVSHRYDTSLYNDRRASASAVARLTVPIYEGGQVYSRTRQAKETAAQRRLDADVAREQVRAQVVATWGEIESTRAQILAAQAQVAAAEIALSGVREEAKVGQRTTLDVLNAQQELLTARSNLVTAQRNRVVSSYTMLSAIGRLNAEALSLRAERHDPIRHYEQVRDKWIGTQTPDGR
jgi:outer membrane protein